MMKKYLLILVFSVFVFSCSNVDREEENVRKTVKEFYNCLNNRDFVGLKACVSGRMNEGLVFLKGRRNDLVRYESCNVRNIVVNGNMAVVEVDCVDEFGNNIVCNWNLVKIDDVWRMDMFDVSNSEILN